MEKNDDNYFTHHKANETTSFKVNFQQNNDNKINLKNKLLNKNKQISNKISTSKYTFFNVIPKILMEQFQKRANIYFLIIAILQSIEAISISGGKPVILLPLICVVSISGLKDFYEDLKRNYSDKEENTRKTEKFDLEKNEFTTCNWENIYNGDIIKIRKGKYFPADIIILRACVVKENLIEEYTDKCYIETKNLDGETNLKQKTIDSELFDYQFYKSNSNFFSDTDKVKLYCTANVNIEKANEIMNRFSGYIEFNSIKKNILIDSNISRNSICDNSNNNFLTKKQNYNTKCNLNLNNFVPRGCSLQITDYIIGIVVYTGTNTKIMMNSPQTKYKISTVEKKMTVLITIIFVTQLILSFIAAVFCFISSRNNNHSIFFRLFYENSKNNKGFIFFTSRICTWILIFTNFVPISLLVSMEMIKYFQGFFISWDIKMYDREKRKSATVQTSTLNEELGMVKYIFTDKTGTLTKNKMIFKMFSVGENVYGGSVDIEEEKKEKERLSFVSNLNIVSDSRKNSKVIVRNNSNKWVNDEEVRKFVDFNMEEKERIIKEIKEYYDSNFNNNKRSSNNNYSSSINNINEQISKLNKTLILMSICHSVINNNIEVVNYLSSSPDESALINASRNLDYVYLGEMFYNSNTISSFCDRYKIKLIKPTSQIKFDNFKNNGDQQLNNNKNTSAYDLDDISKNNMESKQVILIKVNNYLLLFQKLLVMNYNSERKRMSIVIKDLQTNEYMILTKGADTVILDKSADTEANLVNINHTTNNMKKFAKLGLRTLMLAYKELNYFDIKDIIKNHNDILNSSCDEMPNRLSLFYDDIEKDLIVLGSTAIEDELQDNVKECLTNLVDVGIKVWMLTGDKPDTAVSIGFSCGLLNHSTEIVEMTDDIIKNTEVENIKAFLLKKIYTIHKKIEIHGNDNEMKKQENQENLMELVSSNDKDIKKHFSENFDKTKLKYSKTNINKIDKSPLLVQDSNDDYDYYDKYDQNNNESRINHNKRIHTTENSRKHRPNNFSMLSLSKINYVYQQYNNNKGKEDIEEPEDYLTIRKPKLNRKTNKTSINNSKYQNRLNLLKSKTSIVIDSKILAIIIQHQELFDLFKYYSTKCDTVLCCRVSPKQKAEVVKITNQVSLAIGDGANDVNMITTANIGVGIEGEEGGQAARSSDYSISKFCYLQNLLFYHGRESYRKNTYVICYNFYKNVLFVIPQFWFGIASFFSGQTLYDPWIYQLYNMLFTVFPILWYGIADSEEDQDVLSSNGIYYKQGMVNRLFKTSRFWLYVGFGFIEALIIYFLCFHAKYIDNIGLDQDLWSLGTIAYSSIVIIVNVKILIYTSSHTLFSWFFFAISIISYIVTLIVMNKIKAFENFNNFRMVYSVLSFYLSIFLITSSILLVEIGVKKLLFLYGVLQDPLKIQVHEYLREKEMIDQAHIIEELNKNKEMNQCKFNYINIF